MDFKFLLNWAYKLSKRDQRLLKKSGQSQGLKRNLILKFTNHGQQVIDLNQLIHCLKITDKIDIALSSSLDSQITVLKFLVDGYSHKLRTIEFSSYLDKITWAVIQVVFRHEHLKNSMELEKVWFRVVDNIDLKYVR